MQGKPNTNRSVAQYRIEISTDGANYHFNQRVRVFVNRCGLFVCFCLEQNLFNDSRSSQL